MNQLGWGFRQNADHYFLFHNPEECLDWFKSLKVINAESPIVILLLLEQSV